MPKYSSDYGEDNSSHIDRFSSEIPSSPGPGFDLARDFALLFDSETIQDLSNQSNQESSDPLLSAEDYTFNQKVRVRAIINRSTAFEPLPRSDSSRIFSIKLPRSFLQNNSPMAFFELFFSSYIINTLCKNTNQYAAWMKAREEPGS